MSEAPISDGELGVLLAKSWGQSVPYQRMEVILTLLTFRYYFTEHRIVVRLEWWNVTRNVANSAKGLDGIDTRNPTCILCTR